MLWADHLGRPFVFDAETRDVQFLPNPHKTKSTPLCLVVPTAGAGDDDCDSDYALYIMERFPKPEASSCSTHSSDQFEVFIHLKLTLDTYFNRWQYQLLPPPPYIQGPEYGECRSSHHEISSCAVVGVADTRYQYIFISVKGIGAFCLDAAARQTWYKIGKWTLPFRGKVEYVPELKLWFGLTEEDGHLAAADLSAMGPKPELVGCWEQPYVPEEWKECKDSQLVNLGSGRFCITRFFHAADVDENIAVFTGVEVVPLVEDANARSGEVKLHVIPHKSLCHKSTTGVTIDAVF